MSIINDMLRDLDNRSERLPAAESPLSPATPEAKQVNSKKPIVFWFLLALLAVAAVVFFYPVSDEPISLQDPLAVGQAVNEEQTLTQAPAPISVENHSKSEKAAAHTVVATAPLHSEPEVASEVAQAKTVTHKQSGIPLLLSRAESAMQRDRLTVPENNNALYFYRQVLQQDANNQSAIDGLVALKQRYQTLLENNLSAQNFSRLAYLLGRVQVFELGIDTEKYRAAINAHEPGAQSGQPQVPLQTASREPPDSKKAAPQNKVEGTVHIAKTAQSEDADMAAFSWQRFQDGERSQAIQQLERFVNDKPGARQSTLKLFDMYLQTQQLTQARILADKQQAMPTLYRFLNAKLFLAMQQKPEALRELEKTEFESLKQMLAVGAIDSELFENYNALMAALYQAESNYLLAAEKYQMLLGLQTENSSYWLGYAVCSDSLGHANNALFAYRRLARDPQLSQNVKQFIESRLQKLESIAVQNSTAVAAEDGY